MANPYVGEIRLVPYNFAPSGWAFCDGTLMSISQNITLFQLIGTTYGGDGQNTFALPDLRGRVPMHTGNNGTSSYAIGQDAGHEGVQLTIGQIPPHTHQVSVAADATTTSPKGTYPAIAPVNIYGTKSPVTFAQSTLLAWGGKGAHENRQPLLTLNFVISLYGIFPSQS